MNEELFRTLECSDPADQPQGLAFATVKSRALGRRADVTMYVSPGVEGCSDVPVMMLLHGVYGSHWAWALKGHAHRTVARLIEARVLPPLVLLMPSDGLWGDGSGYVPHADHDPEKWVVEEVPALAREVVAGCGESSPLLVAGLSMGGFGALRLAGKYPHRIRAAAGMSSVVQAERFDVLLAEDRHAWSTAPEDRDVACALTGATAPLPPLCIECGLDDPYLQDNRRLHRVLQEQGVAHRYAERPGGHEWEYWSATLEPVLRFFGEVLNTTEDKT